MCEVDGFHNFRAISCYLVFISENISMERRDACNFCSFTSHADQIRRNKDRYEVIGELSCNESDVRFSDYF